MYILWSVMAITIRVFVKAAVPNCVCSKTTNNQHRHFPTGHIRSCRRSVASGRLGGSAIRDGRLTELLPYRTATASRTFCEQASDVRILELVEY